MAHSRYVPMEPFSPFEDDTSTICRSPAPYLQPSASTSYEDEHYGDLGLVGGIGVEMTDVRPTLSKNTTGDSVLFATIFPSHGNSQTDEQPFLEDPMDSLNVYNANAFTPLPDNTGKQLRHILLESLTRWVVTFVLCAGYALATWTWERKHAIGEAEKKWYNAITTGISIALGLNVASAFKDIALNMRWPILALRKRNLVELDLVLNCDSLTKLCKLAIVSRRPMVILRCVAWLLINLLAQTAIAMMSLTYGFNTDTSQVRFTPGLVSVPQMDQIYPSYIAQGRTASTQDEEYAAHLYGEYGYNYGTNYSTYKPEPRTLYQSTIVDVSDSQMIFYHNDSTVVDYVFFDSPVDDGTTTISVYTARTLNVTYDCASYAVTANGNGTSDSIEADVIGAITVPGPVINSTTYWTDSKHTCGSDERCTKIHALEASFTDPWYFECNITMGHTYNDRDNVSYVSDYVAYIATASIAQVGYNDDGVSSQIYPQDSPWGYPTEGDTDSMGLTIATFALGAIAGAAMYNPPKTYYGLTPTQGVILQVGHPYFFYLMLGLICGFHLIFIIVVAVYTNRVMVGPDGYISMALLLRPIADALYGVSNGDENEVFREAKKNTDVIYEKDHVRGKWMFRRIVR